MGILSFYLVAFGFSWSVWIIGNLFLNEHINSLLLVGIGGLGPVLAVIGYFLMAEKEGKEKYIKNLLHIKGIPLKCWLMVFLFPLLLNVVPQMVKYMPLGWANAGIDMIEVSEEFFSGGLWNFAFYFIFGPLPEEMAWRGIAFDILTRKGYLKAQFLVALLWSAWHIPLFFIEGSYQYNLGLLTVGCWLFFINLIFISFITGWIYLASGRSILAAVFFHYFVNLFGEMFVLGYWDDFIYVSIAGLMAVGVLVRPGGRGL